MFHVEQLALALVSAAAIAAAEPTVGYSLKFEDDEYAEPVEEASATEPAPELTPSPAPVDEETAEEVVEVEPEETELKRYPEQNLPLATSDADVARCVEAGMVDLLLGWEESAQRHFEAAIVHGVHPDSECMLAHIGMIMSVPDARLKEENRNKLMEKIDVVAATPVEQFYLATFLKLISREHDAAANDFAERATRYRADTFSAAWAIMLLHCADVGYDDTGRPNMHQARALELAEQFYQQYPEDALICYVRAYIEESAPKISEQALEASAKASQLLPGHPMPQLLHGHLLYRSERAAESVPYFRKAAELAAGAELQPLQERLRMIARLYESTALWSAWRDEEALETRKAMNAVAVDSTCMKTPLMVLLRWEANTLPLRILIRREEAPTVTEIRAAATAATPSPALPGEDTVLKVRNCLRAALYARARMKSGDVQSAQKSLCLAQEALAEFQDTEEDVFAQGVEFITPWYRALEACKIAVLVAGSEVYPDPDEFWKKVAASSMRPGTMLLPPPVPKRCGENPNPKPAASAPSKSAGGHKNSTKNTRKRNRKRRR